MTNSTPWDFDKDEFMAELKDIKEVWEVRFLKIWSINLEWKIVSGILDIEGNEWSIDEILWDCWWIGEKYKVWKETFELWKTFKGSSNSKEFLKQRVRKYEDGEEGGKQGGLEFIPIDLTHDS